MDPTFRDLMEEHLSHQGQHRHQSLLPWSNQTWNYTTWIPQTDMTSCGGPNGTSGDCTDDTWSNIQHTIYHLDKYLVPVIIVVGLVGNVLSFLVFTCTYLRRMSSSVYMAALALADTIFLLVLFFSWLGNFNVMIYHRNGACQIFTYTSLVAGFLSVWYVVCFTVERHLIVCFPLQRQVLCSPRRAKIVVVVFALTGLVIYNFGLWATGLIELSGEPDQPVQYFCTVQQRYYSLVTSINNVDTFVTLIVPAIVITISNVRISYALSRFYRERNQNLLQGCPAPTASGGSNSPSNASLRLSISGPSCNRLQMRVTKMLLIVSTVFVVCNSPSHLVRIYAFGMEQLYTDYQHSEMLAVVQSITNLLYYAGFSTNFFLYNISGKTFRRAFCRLCRCSAHQVTSCMCVRVLKIKPRSNAYPMTRLKRFQIKEADRAGI